MMTAYWILAYKMILTNYFILEMLDITRRASQQIYSLSICTMKSTNVFTNWDFIDLYSGLDIKVYLS